MSEISRFVRAAPFLVGACAVIGGCMVEPDDPPSYEVLNGTDVTVEVRYLFETDARDRAGLDAFQTIVDLDPGEDYQFGSPGGESDACLDAPLVAIGPDGEEIDRLPAGTCADRDVRPTWRITADCRPGWRQLALPQHDDF